MPLLFLSGVIYSMLNDWLLFKCKNLIGLLKFHKALSEILLITCTDQLIHNLSLTKLCSACAKQNAAVNAKDACSLLAKKTLSDLVGQRASSLIITFEKVIKYFLLWNIYITFLFHVPKTPHHLDPGRSVAGSRQRPLDVTI